MNKSDKVREYKAANPEASAPEIQAALKNEKIEVSLPLVYQILKKGATPKRKTSNQRESANGGTGVSVASLLEAKKAVSQIGSIEETRKALDLLARLQS